METAATRQPAGCAAPDGNTRQRVARLLLEKSGGATARELSTLLDITPVAVRKHLDAMAADGLVEGRTPEVEPGRSRGRPARTYRLTDAARDTFDHHYDDLAAQALRWISTHGGPAAVAAFAAEQVAHLEENCRDAVAAADETPMGRASALAEALSREGYAATATAIADGGQLCQHHCPVAHVAAEFPQLCEAETEVIGRLAGKHVQRLATIAGGHGVCTTYIPPGQAGKTSSAIDNTDR